MQRLQNHPKDRREVFVRIVELARGDNGKGKICVLGERLGAAPSRKRSSAFQTRRSENTTKALMLNSRLAAYRRILAACSAVQHSWIAVRGFWYR